MTEIHDPSAPRRDELRLLLKDLACVSGTLSEIMTVWRDIAVYRGGQPRHQPRPGALGRGHGPVSTTLRQRGEAYVPAPNPHDALHARPPDQKPCSASRATDAGAAPVPVTG